MYKEKRNEEGVMEARRLESLKQIAAGIAAQFGDKCEVVIHDVSGSHPEHTIVHVVDVDDLLRLGLLPVPGEHELAQLLMHEQRSSATSARW